MRDLIVTENVTLDGVIEAAGDWFAPANTDGDRSDMAAALQRQAEMADAFLTGRVTFEEMRSYWPHRTEDGSYVAEYLGRAQKYVFSGTLTSPEWQHTTVLRGTLEAEIRGLKAEPGRDIVATGSISLVHALAAAGVVDEYRLFVHPVVLGAGRRLFPDGAAPRRLRLTETSAFACGVVLLRYRVG